VSAILATKLHPPPARAKVVFRAALIDRLDEAFERKASVTLISAPAGFGKTTLASEWAASKKKSVGWLSLDEADKDPARFLLYLVEAVRALDPDFGANLSTTLRSPQPPDPQSIITLLLNELNSLPDKFALVLDDYHTIDSKPVDAALGFLLEHLPPKMNLIITTREDPQLPLARLRASGQLTELRINDLRFEPAEVAEFLNDVMGLRLESVEIDALETRTEGWIAGLQLAAISLQGHHDATAFIKSFSGSHRFVMDYLVEEVLRQQPETVQTFLLSTSILDRMCGALCDALLLSASGSGQETLEHLEHSNLFIIPLDNERQWYRYHHLFAELLRQRRHQFGAGSALKLATVDELHHRASVWFEQAGLEVDAFQHAGAANDYERAERLIEGNGMPLHFRGAVAPVLNWLESLPRTVLDARPSLWTAFASTLLVTGQLTRAEQAIQAADAALESAELDVKTKDLIGRVAATRATAAVGRNDLEAIIIQSSRALEYLHPNNVAFRTSTAWKLGYAYQMQGNREAARQAYDEVISIGEASGNMVFAAMATIGLGALYEGDNQLERAERTYRDALRVLGDPPLRFASQAYLGLAHIAYEWNDLETAGRHARLSAQLSRQVENNDRFIISEIFVAHVKLAQGDLTGAETILSSASRIVRERGFTDREPDVATEQVLLLLRQKKVAAAARVAQSHNLPLSQARIHLANEKQSDALKLLERYRREAEAKRWADELLKAMVLQTVALSALGEREQAVELLREALVLAETGGFVRLFVDEGRYIADLLPAIVARGIVPDYARRLLEAFESDRQRNNENGSTAQQLIDPLSKRELEILRLIAQGLSNKEISERLFLALVTVKGHNQRIFAKLQVQRRTEAVARAREIGLL
jgi:LuxR family transcriptional regulator, maltose regulon positive regulatory protein